MKILMTADAVGGVWSYAMDLCRGLARHGVDIALALMGPPPTPAQRRDAQSLPNVRLHVGPWKLEWMDEPWRDIGQAGTWLLEIARDERVDLVHLNGYAHAALPFDRPVLCVAHSCVCSWWQAVHGVPAPQEWQLYRAAVAAGLRAANAIVAPTDAFLRTLRTLYGPMAAARVIHNGRDGARLRRDALRRARAPLVLGCGRVWDAAKNLAVLDEAAAALCERAPQTRSSQTADADASRWEVVVAGDTVSPDGRSGALRAARCLGALRPSGVQRWMRRAAIFAHPALYEPFGLAVAEAAAQGCALLLSDLPSLRELWGGAASFADPRDPAAWREQLLHLIAQPTLRNELAYAAWERAARFDAPRMCAEYAALYAQLTRSSPQELAVA